MTTRDTPWPDSTPCWTDLAVADSDATRLFYESLFGWNIEPGNPKYGGYAICRKGGRQVCAIAPKMSPEQPAAWTSYLATSDAEASAARITESGGTLVVEPMRIDDLGTMVVALDPAGATFGLWQAEQHTGAQLANAPGAVIWNEQLSPNWQACKTFYQQVLDIAYRDMSADDFHYATIQVGGRDVAGIGQSAPDEPARWAVYFGAEDTDETVDQAVKLGASLVSPPADTPYGRIAVLADLEGANFAVMAAPAEGYDDAAG